MRLSPPIRGQVWKPELTKAQRRLWRFFCVRCVMPASMAGVQGSFVLAGFLSRRFLTPARPPPFAGWLTNRSRGGHEHEARKRCNYSSQHAVDWW